MKSALYQGWVTHKRFATEATGDVAHEFRYRTTMPLLFLDELSEVVAQHPRWSMAGVNAVWFRRSDFGGDQGRSLENSIRDEVQLATGVRPQGRVAMLGHLRTWGFLFNPLTTFYVYAENEEDVDHVVLEVRSTPWLERHRYVLNGREPKQRFMKELHVSPFLGMDHEYVFSSTTPGEHLSLHLGNRRGEERIFDAGLSLDRVALDSTSMGKLVWRQPLMTYGVTCGIYREALKLWRKKAPFFTHPAKTPAK